jgi:hypothetical protein
MKPGFQSVSSAHSSSQPEPLSSTLPAASQPARLPRLLSALLFGLLLPGLLLLTGCTPWLNAFTRSTETPLEFRIRQVEAADRPGLYAVAGETTLPDKTRITVTALRSLAQTGSQPSDQPAQIVPNYAILDRQIAEVKQGTWKADLNLWQVAPDGEFQEAWQLNQSMLGVRFRPQPEVTFLAMLEPANQPAELKPRLESLGNSPRASSVQYTPEGERYLQASQTLAIALPTGKTLPPAPQAQPKPTGQAIKATPPTETEEQPWKQTSAPIAPEAFLR